VDITDSFDSPVSSKLDPYEVVSSLLDYSNCNLNLQDKYGRTPLHYAAQRDSIISTIYMI
jgi:ankyrin repeat protein